jgi:arabinose-5-phosphate isomerase
MRRSSNTIFFTPCVSFAATTADIIASNNNREHLQTAALERTGRHLQPIVGNLLENIIILSCTQQCNVSPVKSADRVPPRIYIFNSWKGASIHMNYLKRARAILDAEADALRTVPLDRNFSQAIEILNKCRGKIITTGMGKAGIIAHKTASTLCSTGTPASFLHPGEAAHGDLGLLAPGDVIIAFSTSGKTREIIEMLELAHHFGIDHIIGITSHPDSAIRKLSTVVINMGVIAEPCSLGLTPTASTIAMLALGDALALVLMEKKKFSRIDYGLRHHGGYLGQKARQGGGEPPGEKSSNDKQKASGKISRKK